MARVELQRVCKRYDGTALAVSDLDLVCEPGEMLALLGPSGCGKSSTLKMIAGIEVVSSGRILFDDRDVTSLDSAARNVAMVFEDYALYPHLTVRQNIAFPLSVRGVAGSQIESKVSEVIAMLGLQAFEGSTVRALSGGAQQRVSIGRALVRDPSLVMFDEPLSHLDADQKVTLRTEIRRMQSTQGLTSLLVTHDQSEAMAMADRIAVMNHGVLQQVGPPMTLYEHPVNRFVAGFIGSTPMNFLAARLDDRGRISIDSRDSDGGGDLAGHDHDPRSPDGAGLEVVLGIRPEHIRLGSPADRSSVRLAARVLDREAGGDHDVIRLDSHVGTVHIEIPPRTKLRAGDRIECHLPRDLVHLFDCREGKVLADAPRC